MRPPASVLCDGRVPTRETPASPTSIDPARLPTPPHLAEPELAYVTEPTWSSWQERVQDGFHETLNPAWATLGRSLFPAQGCFGMRVDQQWVATASSTPRRLSVPGGGEIECSAVSDVTVSSAYRRRGILRQLMTHQLRTLAAQGVPLAGLWASESSIYGRFGYGVATWESEMSGSTGRTDFLPDVEFAGSTAEVDETNWLKAAAPVWEHVRARQPGMFDRSGDWWRLETWDPEKEREAFTARRYLVHFDTDGAVDGTGTFQVKPDWSTKDPEGRIKIGPVLATNPTAYAGLWRYQLDVDLATTFTSSTVAVDEPLLQLLSSPRALRAQSVDGLYLRILDVVRALEARSYSADVDTVLQIDDGLLQQVDGRYRLTVRDGQAQVTRTDDDPDLTFGIRELGCVYLGGPTIAELHRAGRVSERVAGAARTLSTAFGWHRAPHCPDHF